tara:strand:- start:349 stop:873 length:525 start_codon:yes stop_codon:yes gene_type:complete
MKNILFFIFYLSILNLYSQVEKKSIEDSGQDNILTGICVSGNCNMGYGIMKWQDETTYIGNFWNEIPSGEGTVIWSDGSIYVGKFNEGMYSGKGTLITNRSLYIGEFNEDAPNGFGTLLIEPGMYVGEFLNGELEGKGIFINKVGLIEEAIFKNNNPTGDTILIRENYILRGTK